MKLTTFFIITSILAILSLAACVSKGFNSKAPEDREPAASYSVPVAPLCYRLQPMKSGSQTFPWAEYPEQTSYLRVFGLSPCDRPEAEIRPTGTKQELESFATHFCERNLKLKFKMISTWVSAPHAQSQFVKLGFIQGRPVFTAVQTAETESLAEIHCLVNNVENLRAIPDIQYSEGYKLIHDQCACACGGATADCCENPRAGQPAMCPQR